MKQTKFFVILDLFYPFIPSPALHSAALIIPNIKNWKKMKKMPGDIIIVLHKHVYHKWRSYNMWFLKYEVQQTEFFVILGNFLPFYLLTTKFWKNEKTLGDIIILRMCTIYDNHMMYGFWDMERDGQYFLSFWTVFCSFIPLTTRKIKLLKKWKKKPDDVIILHECSKNHDHMLHYSWDTMHDRCNSYFLFWTIFHPFTHLTTQKIKNF